MPLVALALVLTGCMDDENERRTYTHIYNFELTTSEMFLDNGEWVSAYDPDVTSVLVSPNLTFWHYASSDVYDGVEYKSWKGFCASRACDFADHGKDANWVDYQWSSAGLSTNITGGGGVGGSMDYLIGCWDVQETVGIIPDEPSCAMAFGGTETQPLEVWVNNSNWGYWAMKNGTAYSKAFGPNDWCKLVFYGTDSRRLITGQTEFYLAKDGNIVNEWTVVDLTPLGECSHMIIQMESSDTGQWGMNNPAYFCLDNLSVKFTEE